MDFRERYGPWAFIAGGSMGIGAALSHEAAARGLNVAMLARGGNQLERTADAVRQRQGVEVRTIVADLAEPVGGVGQVVADATDRLEIGLFVYNATTAPNGRFIDLPLDEQLTSVVVNCATPVILCHLLAPKMVERRRGGIGLVGSMGGTQGSINFALYNAGKAFEWVLAESLWSELGEAGVDVTTIFVGPTSSPNYNAWKDTLDPELTGRRDSENPLDRARARLVDPSTPEDVALALYDQMANGPVCYAHRDDEWISRATFALPRDEAVGVWRGVQETATQPRVPTKGREP